MTTTWRGRRRPLEQLTQSLGAGASGQPRGGAISVDVRASDRALSLRCTALGRFASRLDAGRARCRSASTAPCGPRTTAGLDLRRADATRPARRPIASTRQSPRPGCGSPVGTIRPSTPSRDELGGAAGVGGDDRRLERHRFEHRVRRALVVGRLHEQVEGVVEVDDVVAVAEQAAGVAEAQARRLCSRSALAQAAVAGDQQLQLRARRAADRANASISRSKRFCGSSRPTAPITDVVGGEAELPRASGCRAPRSRRNARWSMPFEHRRDRARRRRRARSARRGSRSTPRRRAGSARSSRLSAG